MNAAYDIGDLKLPPCSIEAEMAIIGALIHKPDSYDQIDWLSAADFFNGRHRMIYGTIRSMMEHGEAVDILLLCEKLDAQKELGEVGGVSYVGKIASENFSAANIRKYAEIVRERALLRGLQALANDLTDKAFEPGANPGELAEATESGLNDLRHGRDESEPLPFHRTLDAALQARNQPDTGIHTGITELDRMLRPLRGGQLIVIAGRSSMGKSALALNINEHVAKTEPVGLWSLEMSRADLGERTLAWHEHKWGIDSALAKLTMLQLHIDCPHTLSIGGLRLRAKRLRRRHGLKMLTVDYLGLMRGDGENRTQQIGSISRGLKGLAVELDIPIIAVAQLNRQNEQRTDKRPMLADLRESGDIEQDADMVLMLYRDDYYNYGSAAKGTAEILIRKNRSGPTGMVRTAWIDRYTRFENYSGPSIDDIPTQPAPTRKRRTMPDFRSQQAGPDA